MHVHTVTIYIYLNTGLDIAWQDILDARAAAVVRKVSGGSGVVAERQEEM